MNNKELFEQSARKILSTNQLEGVMKLHNVLFENQSPEQMAETVADAVKDAVDDAVDTAANDQVIKDVAETNPSRISPEDQVKLESLFESMNDDEKMAFLEGLDDQQVQVLMEGPWTWAKNMFTKAGRSANRVNKFGNLSRKEAELSAKMDQAMNLNPYMLSKKNAKKIDQLNSELGKVRTNMNDMRAKAMGTPEFDKLTETGLKNGSKNFNVNEIEKMKGNLEQMKANVEGEMNKKFAEIDKAYEDAVANYTEKLKLKTIQQNTYNKKVNEFLKARNEARAKVADAYEPQLAEFNSRIGEFNNSINMAKKEASFGQGFNRGHNNGTNHPFSGYQNAPQYGQFGIPAYANVGKPVSLNTLINHIPILGTINKIRIGAWAGLKAVISAGTLGALGYGAYTVWDYFKKPDELDATLGDDDGTTTENVKKVLYVLAGGAAGNIGARFLGFNSTTGKTVGTLLGAALVGYFMYLNGGDEKKAVELLDTYNNASEADQSAINEALQIDGYAELLQQMYDGKNAD